MPERCASAQLHRSSRDIGCPKPAVSATAALAGVAWQVRGGGPAVLAACRTSAALRRHRSQIRHAMLAITSPPHHTVSQICRPRQPSQVRNAPVIRPITALRTMKSPVVPYAVSVGSSSIRYRTRLRLDPGQARRGGCSRTCGARESGRATGGLRCAMKCDVRHAPGCAMMARGGDRRPPYADLRMR